MHRGTRAEGEDIFLEAARGDDFVGVQTYSRVRFGPQSIMRPEDGVEITQMLDDRPKFGVIAVDRETQQRTVKPSAEWLGKNRAINTL